MKHTRGKWIASPGKTSYVIMADIKDCKADERTSICKTWGKEDIDLANAKVIEAAPEMIQALKYVHNLFKKSHNNGTLTDTQYTVWNIVKEAIQKVS